MFNPEPYEIWLIDPTGESSPELVYKAGSRRECRAFVEEWEKDDLGLTAEVRYNPVELPEEEFPDDDYELHLAMPLEAS